MAARWVYRGIEEQALLGHGSEDQHPHSFLARQLRYAYRESRDLLGLALSRVQAIASVYGNPHLDAKKGMQDLMERIGDLQGFIPYMRSSSSNKNREDDIQHGLRLLRALSKHVSSEDIAQEIATIDAAVDQQA